MAVLREENERMLQRQLKFKEEMDEDRQAIKVRLDELRTHKYAMLQEHNNEIRRKN